MRRLCRTLGATGIVRLGAPLPDELGYAESIDVEEISSAKVCLRDLFPFAYPVVR